MIYRSEVRLMAHQARFGIAGKCLACSVDNDWSRSFDLNGDICEASTDKVDKLARDGLVGPMVRSTKSREEIPS